MVQAIQDGYSLQLRLVHPKHFQVDIFAAGAPLGIELKAFREDSTLLDVRNITTGAVSDFNKDTPYDKVEVDDLVVGVNGVSESCELMTQALGSRRTVQLELLRV